MKKVDIITDLLVLIAMLIIAGTTLVINTFIGLYVIAIELIILSFCISRLKGGGEN